MREHLAAGKLVVFVVVVIMIYLHLRLLRAQRPFMKSMQTGSAAGTWPLPLRPPARCRGGCAKRHSCSARLQVLRRNSRQTSRRCGADRVCGPFAFWLARGHFGTTGFVAADAAAAAVATGKFCGRSSGSGVLIKRVSRAASHGGGWPGALTVLLLLGRLLL